MCLVFIIKKNKNKIIWNKKFCAMHKEANMRNTERSGQKLEQNLIKGTCFSFYLFCIMSFTDISESLQVHIYSSPASTANSDALPQLVILYAFLLEENGLFSSISVFCCETVLPFPIKMQFSRWHSIKYGIYVFLCMQTYFLIIKFTLFRLY